MKFYRCCASRGKILPLPSLLAKFYLISAFLSIVRTSATASFGVKFHRRAQPVFNHAVRFVVNFTAVRARFDRRSFITKRLLKTKPAAALPPGFYLFSAEPQILKFSLLCFALKFRRNFTRRAENSDLLSNQSRCRLAQNSCDKFCATFVRLRYRHTAFYRRRDDVF